MAQQRRPLTAGEIDWARQAFGDRIPYTRLALINGAGGNPIAMAAIRNGNSAITLGRSIYFNPGYYLADFAVAKPAARGLLIHELTHVWQYQQMGMPRFLLRYGREFAAVGFTAWRMYEYEAGKTPFRPAMLEAQAEMVGNYAEAKAGGDAAKLALVGKNLAGSGLFGC